jgi:predicted nucleic acid-binding protein
MTLPLVVADSSPLIAFERVGHLFLLPALAERVCIPPAVRREVFGDQPLPAWVEERPLGQPLAPKMTAGRLGPGEREAIALALEMGADEVILDDLAARRLATSLGLCVIGTLGLLLRTKQRGLIPKIQPVLEALQDCEFRISEQVYSGILAAAGEM